MIPVQEAHAVIRACIPSPRVTSAAVSEAQGRILAEDILAPFALPRFDNSAMDGFAVRWEDTRKAGEDRPVVLTQLGTVSAGQPASMKVGSGDCAQVMTGAPIPAGADAVVMVEYTSGYSENDRVEVRRPVRKGENIRFEGEEIQAGEAVLTAGSRIGPAEMGILAAFGRQQVNLYNRPRVALLVTGTELKDAGETLGQGEIYNSNLPLLEDLVHRAGGKIISSGAVQDDPASMGSFMEKALGSCDFLISSGGVSAGRFDLIREVAQGLDVKERFHRVAQKPGKPLFFATAGETL
ncbi:MAG: gephyrin-like molybdotransferase Glp, partial [Fidelibacterota bacterium]